MEAKLRRITFQVDEDDFNTIQAEITHRQVRSRAVDPTAPTSIPDGDSDLMGALIAEMIRDLNEYRAIYEAANPLDT